MRTTKTVEDNQGASAPRKRVPIHGLRDKLTVKGIPEHLHPCWVNDYNVQRYQDAGYGFWTGDAVVGDDGSTSLATVTDSVISRNVGNGVVAYLMVIPKEWHEEDMKAMHTDVDEKEQILFRQQKQSEGRYGNIEVKHGARKAL